MHNTLKYLIIAVIMGGAVFLFYSKVYVPKTTFTTISPTKGELHVHVFGIGNVGAQNIYTINAQTGGKILSISTDEGEWVKKGDLLVTIDPIDLPLLLEEANIAVRKANSEWIASRKELQSLQAQRNLAHITFGRYAKLKKQSFVSQSEYDRAKADLDALNAQIEAARARISSAEMEMQRARKGVQTIEVKLTRHTIHAPVDGYVIDKGAEAAQTVTPSQSILKIVDPKTVWIQAYIDEKRSGRVIVGQKTTITLRSQYDKKFSGRVKRIAPQSDAVTQEREVNIVFDELPMPFFINEQAEVTIATKTFTDVIKIPASALTYYKGKAGLWIDDRKKAHFQSVKIIARGENELAVSGIDENTKIIINS